MEKLYLRNYSASNMLNKILSLLTLFVSVLALVFVGIILIYKFYIKIRTKFDIIVNCWFCNKNTRVAYQNRNCWNCPNCEQYNGFNKDGGYNCDITNMIMDNSSNISGSSCLNVNNSRNLTKIGYTFVERSEKSFNSHNGFCSSCNEAQRLKVEKLSQFEPKNESRFDEELMAYKTLLEEQYRLCTTCEHHLRRVLREKKKMVLGAKFIDFIIRGAKIMEQPHYSHLKRIQNEKKMHRIVVMIIILTFINIFCLLNGLPAIPRDKFIDVLGSFCGKYAFIIYSHLVTTVRVINSYLDIIFQIGVIGKFRMLLRTLLVMFLYTLEMTLPVGTNQSISELYWRVYPFMILILTIVYNIRDGLKFSRCTALLIYWSIFSIKLISIDFNYLLLLGSIGTLILSLAKKSKCYKKDNSFHTIPSEDYFSDDSISMLSQQLNVSGTRSDLSSKKYEMQRHRRLNASTSSSILTTNGSIFGNLRESSTTFSNMNGHGPSSNYGIAKNGFSGSSSLFSSNLELHNRGVTDHHDPNRRSVNELNASLQSAISAPNIGLVNTYSHEKQHKNSNNHYPVSIQNLPQQQQLFQQFVPSPMHSFSTSNASIYQQQQQQPLLKSHFHSMSNGCGFVENYNNNNISCNNPKPLVVTSNTNINTRGLLKENFSNVTSSLSSGFASQTGNIRNIESPYTIYPTHETLTLPYSNGSGNYLTSFTPNSAIISSGPFVRQPLISHSNHHNTYENGSIASFGFSYDSFNLSKMNDELPAIKSSELMNID